MARSLYLVNPKADFPTYYTAEVMEGIGLRPAAFAADLAIATVAALAPPDFHVTLGDESAGPIDYDSDAEVIGITGKVSQWGRMAQAAAEFRRRGKPVMIGGSFASLCPDVVRPHCDILVRGEIEEVAETIFADLREGRWKDEYAGGRPDLALSPVPRWELYPNGHAMLGSLQTSRGCPFECDFCDVIQYVGRKQRHKPVSLVLAELDKLYALGYRLVFLADDNFTVYRQRAKALLDALRHWNQRRSAGRVRFVTQLSIDAADDDELLTMCAAAGLTTVFIGIETPNAESLRESKKRQNLKGSLVDRVDRFVAHGICVMGGMMCGFDADGLDIFDRQFEFAMATPVMHFSLGALVAPAATPLHARMAREGRLIPGGFEGAALPWGTNIVPKRMTVDELMQGVQRLGRRLYDPEAFGERAVRFIERVWISPDPASPAGPFGLRDMGERPVDLDSLEVLQRVRHLGPAEHAMWKRIRRALHKKPGAELVMMSTLVQYLQVRHMFALGRFWEARIAA
jgi:radical SAM superfamily enzyme YgiQ (UPF0313 family)